MSAITIWQACREGIDRKMTRERVMTDPKELVRIELKKAGFELDSMQVPKRVYLLADDIYDAMIEKGWGEYKYPLGGALYVFKNNPQIGFIKGKMCSPGIHDTAVASLYGFHHDILETTPSLTDEMESLLRKKGIEPKRGKHWTTDAGYHETWGQVLDYRAKGALCVEMEGAGLFAIAQYRKCSAAAIYIITDVITEEGWHIGWEDNKIGEAVAKVTEVIL